MILDRFSLKGKVAIVTGAGRGIGKGVALVFAEAGADLVCAARTVSEIESTAAEVHKLGRKALAIPCDVQESQQVDNMVNKTLKELGHIDILVNNAAGGSYAGSMEMSEAVFEADLRHDLTSVFMCSKAAAKVMLEQKAGSIINISSGYSQLPSLGMPAYGAAKAGINSLTRTMAWELAPYVRVNAILPGCICTEGAAMMMVGKAHDKIIDGTPMKRMGTPEDIGLAALYLASSASDFVTGRLFQIDGGIEFVPLSIEDFIPQQ